MWRAFLFCFFFLLIEVEVMNSPGAVGAARERRSTLCSRASFIVPVK